MAVTRQYIGNISYVKLTGNVRASELFEIVLDGNHSARFTSVKFRVVDALEADSVDYGQNEFPTYMTLDKASSVHNETLTVIIATKPEHKHIAEKYELAMTNTQWNIVLVDSLQEAELLCNEKQLSFLQGISV